VLTFLASKPAESIKLHAKIPKQIFTYNPCVCETETQLKLNLSQDTPQKQKYNKMEKATTTKTTKGTTIKAKKKIVFEIISGILINNKNHKNMLQNILIGFVLYKFPSASHIYYTLG